jgi:tRNA A22 N-methylase
MSEKFSFPDDELNTELYESIKKELLKKKDEICRDRIENELMKVQEKEENLNHENNEKIEKLKKRIDLVKYESEISPSNAS